MNESATYSCACLVMSAFGGKADIKHDPAECLLLTQSGHLAHRLARLELEERAAENVTVRTVNSDRLEAFMGTAPHLLVGKSLEWRGVHHSVQGDFTDISTHTVSYETETGCYVTAGGKLVGEASYTYKRLDDRMAICIYRPKEWQGRSDVVLNAMFDFADMKDRAVILAGGEPFAVADGSMREVETQPRP